MLCEVVKMFGEPERMSSKEVYFVMVQVYWQLKPEAVWEAFAQLSISVSTREFIRANLYSLPECLFFFRASMDL